MSAPGYVLAIANALLSGTPDAWHLGEVATLAGPAKADPLLSLASDMFMKTPSGVSFRNELKKLFGNPRRISVEVHGDVDAFARRRATLSRTILTEGGASGVNGYTHLFVPGGASAAEDPADVIARASFIVLVALPRPRPALVLNEDEWVITSAPFRTMRLAVTLFHEMRHIWWARTQKDAAADLAFGNPGEEPYFDELGHGDDAGFSIDLRTLALDTAGSIQPRFLRLLRAFVTDLVDKNDLKTAIAEQRRLFAARPNP